MMKSRTRLAVYTSDRKNERPCVRLLVGRNGQTCTGSTWSDTPLLSWTFSAIDGEDIQSLWLLEPVKNLGCISNTEGARPAAVES